MAIQWPEFTVTQASLLTDKVRGLPEVLPDGSLVFRVERTVPTGHSSIVRNVIIRAYAAGQWRTFTTEPS